MANKNNNALIAQADQFINYFNNFDPKRMAGIVNQMYFLQKVFAGLEANAS